MPESISAPTTSPTPPAPPSPSPNSAPKSAPLAGDKPSDIIQSPESDNIFEGAFAEIDAEAGIETEKQDKHNRGIKPEKSKDDKAKANGDHKPNGETKPDAEDVPKTPAELRKRYEGLKDKIAKEYEPQLKELPTLRAKLKELESRDESGAKLIQEEVESIKKRNAELEQHMRFVDYEKSAEYQEQFHKPYVDAWSSALRDIRQIRNRKCPPVSAREQLDDA